MTEPGPAEPWLAVKSLGFRYGSRAALENLRLDFFGGRHYILAGPNGAGKSTLLDLLANLKKPAAGGVSLRGEPLAAYSAARLALNLALAPQDFRFDFAFTAREAAALGRRPYLGRWGRLGDRDRRAVEAALARLDLAALAERPVTALSGGEKQRVNLARALAQETAILLLDEPTAGLDVAHALTVMDLARAKAAAGALVITVTHDLNLGAAFGHEFVFLKNGRTAAAGPTDAVFTGPVLAGIYETEASVAPDPFTGKPRASFRLPEGA